MNRPVDVSKVRPLPRQHQAFDLTSFRPDDKLEHISNHARDASQLSEDLTTSVHRHMERMSSHHGARLDAAVAAWLAGVQNFARGFGSTKPLEDMAEYLRDRGERAVLTLDTLRERGDIFLEHEAADCPPVLIYDYDVIVDGANLPRPCNYMLLKIKPPEGIVVNDWKRPYIIIDPRAGHGAGIGGFKTDSQVGVALKDGHPVYFVSFKRRPVHGQTLADVTHAEAEFVREVVRRHPDAPKPVVTGNCQGGWATLILAAMNPDITGPVVLNGAPVDTWAGELGRNPMRYNAGLLGGTWQPMLWSDLGNGVFDGAHLVLNFEMLNPSRNYFRKYYDLFAKVDTERARFLEFEKWWGGFFLLNEAEIHWIVEQLFVGDRLVKNEARLEPGRVIDVKKIRSPIIVFASHGDNITPPQQALDWIVDSYPEVSEIQIRGQRIIYMVHEQVGHLGIFVSSTIARREHTEVTSTLKTIEALAPGLYEMKIENVEGEGIDKTFTVSFHERTLDDIRALDDSRADEIPFAAVDRASIFQAEIYDVAVRPFVKAAVNEAAAEMSRALHPLRTQRALASSENPAMSLLPDLAGHVAARRQPAAADNPFVALEKVQADLFEQMIDVFRDVRDMWAEVMFFGLWGTPLARWYGRGHQIRRTMKNEAELRGLPEVEAALRHVARGGFVEAVIRMLVLIAGSRGAVRRDRLERSALVLSHDEPFRSLTAERRAQIIHEQTLAVHFDREEAINTLPKLVKTPEERALAAEVAQFIAGPIKEMAPDTVDMFTRIRELLELPPMTEDVTEDPLADFRETRPTKHAPMPEVAK